MHKVLEAIRNSSEVDYNNRIWKFWYDNLLREGQKQIDIDHFLLEQHFEENIPSTIRIWQNRPCLVLSKRDARLCRAEFLSQYSKKIGVPLYVRSSGGTVVPHGPNILNISLVFSEKDQKISVASSYIILCNYVSDLLKGVGLMAETGNVTGAFCDGKYNLILNGKKVGGTAQRVKKRKNGSKVFLAHMSLLLGGDVKEISDLISCYYDVIGQENKSRSDAITTISHELQDGFNVSTLVRGII